MRQIVLVLAFSLSIATVTLASEPVFRGLSWGDPIDALGDVEPVPLDGIAFCSSPDFPNVCTAQKNASDLAKLFLDRDVKPSVYEGSLDITVYVDLDPEPLGPLEPLYVLYLVAGGELVGIKVYIWDGQETMSAALRIRYGPPARETYSAHTWLDGDTQIDWTGSSMTLYSPDIWTHYRKLMDKEDERRAEEERLLEEQRARDAAYSW